MSQTTNSHIRSALLDHNGRNGNYILSFTEEGAASIKRNSLLAAHTMAKAALDYGFTGLISPRVSMLNHGLHEQLDTRDIAIHTFEQTDMDIAVLDNQIILQCFINAAASHNALGRKVGYIATPEYMLKSPNRLEVIHDGLKIGSCVIKNTVAMATTRQPGLPRTHIASGYVLR